MFRFLWSSLRNIMTHLSVTSRFVALLNAFSFAKVERMIKIPRNILPLQGEGENLTAAFHRLYPNLGIPLNFNPHSLALFIHSSSL